MYVLGDFLQLPHFHRLFTQSNCRTPHFHRLFIQRNEQHPLSVNHQTDLLNSVPFASNPSFTLWSTPGTVLSSLLATSI